MNTKYEIFSKSRGWFVGFYDGKNVFSHERTIVYEFLSETGAKAHLEIMPLMAETPDDCQVVPSYETKQI